MKRSVTRILKSLSYAGVLLCAAFMLPAFGQDYPDKPVRLIVPWPPGGLVDIAGRAAGRALQASLGQPVVVDNRPGAGGVIGADGVAKAPPDGYTLMLTTSALTMNAALRPSLPFKVTSDFAPVGLVAWAPSVLVVHPGLGVTSVRELIALARSKPDKLSYASAGEGTPAHLSGELFKSMMGISLLHVPYKGAPQAMTDVISGQVDLLFANAAVALPQIKSGRVRALAVTSAERFAALSELPTMHEAGVTNFEADQWLGIFAPAATPPAVLARLRAEIDKALGNSEVRAALEQSGMTPAAVGTRAQFAAYLKQDLEKWSGVVKSAKIKPE